MIIDLLLFQKLHGRLVNFQNPLETPHGRDLMLWEGREDESHLEEKDSQETHLHWDQL